MRVCRRGASRPHDPAYELIVGDAEGRLRHPEVTTQRADRVTPVP